MNIFIPPDFIHDFSSCESCFVTLCIYHDNISSDEVTEMLLMQPSKQRKIGELLGMGIFVKRNGWFLSTEDLVDSRDIRAHIWDLILKISEKNDVIANLIGFGHEIIMSCYWDSASGNGGPILDAKTMAALSFLGIDLHFDVWFSCQ